MKETFYNSLAYFTTTRIDSSGFREYDARWIIEPLETGGDVQINYRGFQLLGNFLGRFLALPENGAHSSIVVGHDFRKYSENAKNALVLGLLQSGQHVHDAGLCLSPMVYFAQYEYSIPACAVVTASHNPNGWTGVKMGHQHSLTFGPDRMEAFREYVASQDVPASSAVGKYTRHEDVLERYRDHLLSFWRPKLGTLPRLRVAIETGNGTAGMIIPDLLSEVGFDVATGHVDLNWNFPNFNPNPENVEFLKSVKHIVESNQADVGLCFDGDGDRLGAVDNKGRLVFSDRIGVLIAKRIEQEMGPSRFVIDVKSTSLYLQELQSDVVWEKSGHSYIKAALHREKATAGFERSGHFFFSQPFGRGYDDACVSALLLLWILCEAKANGKTFSDLLDEIPASHQSPNRQPKVPEDRKYEIVAEARQRIEASVADTGRFAGVEVADILTINGVRVHFVDGSWLLIRASSNTPNLVILAESFDEDGSRLKELDEAARHALAGLEDVGHFDPLYSS